jgi:NAD(P)-dependent dehydrogenase (short-subunit alcohol dehydrogenase family)
VNLLTSGIGLALAKDLHQKGWKLTIVDMNSTQGEAIVADFGEENALFIKADVSKWEENVRFFKVTKEKFGHIDFGTLLSFCSYEVAANAGIDDSQNLYSEASTDGLTKPNYKTIEVDLFGPLYASQLALHYFRASSKGGKIVVTSSTAGIYASPAVPQYCTAKFGAIGLVRSMGGNQGLKNQNITVNAVCPSFVATGLAPRELLKGDILGIKANHQ